VTHFYLKDYGNEPIHPRDPVGGETPTDPLPVAAGERTVSGTVGQDLRFLSHDGRYEWVQFASDPGHVCIRGVIGGERTASVRLTLAQAEDSPSRRHCLPRLQGLRRLQPPHSRNRLAIDAKYG
jgi:hypothetical protein